jgi:general secretion pathway protein M
MPAFDCGAHEMWDRVDAAFRESVIGRWFVSLEPNERTMVSGLFVFLCIVVLYLGIWRPLNEWSSNADAQYRRQLAVVDWMKLHENEARAAGQRGDGGRESGSLLTTVANSAAHAGIHLLRYQPEGGGVSVVLQNQSFSALISWISQLEQENHVSVKQLSIDGQGEAGLVNARIILI